MIALSGRSLFPNIRLAIPLWLHAHYEHNQGNPHQAFSEHSRHRIILLWSAEYLNRQKQLRKIQLIGHHRFSVWPFEPRFGHWPVEIVFTFNRPGYPLNPERAIASSDHLRGNSHLKIGTSFRVEAVAESERFLCEGRANEDGFLAAMTMRCNAQNLRDASNKCYRALTPLLSTFSLRWDVPLVVYQVDAHEIKTGTRSFTNRNAFLEVTLSGSFNVTANPELRTYCSVYREALITESITYQFLCFYRLIESVEARRTRLERDARRSGSVYTPPTEIYPSTAAEAVTWLDSIFPVRLGKWDDLTLNSILIPEACGKTFGAIADGEPKSLRDNIAHTLLQRAGELVSMDDPLAREKVEKWLPPIKCIARTMLKNDFPTDLA